MRMYQPIFQSSMMLGKYKNKWKLFDFFFLSTLAFKKTRLFSFGIEGTLICGKWYRAQSFRNFPRVECKQRKMWKFYFNALSFKATVLTEVLTYRMGSPNTEHSNLCRYSDRDIYTNLSSICLWFRLLDINQE